MRRSAVVQPKTKSVGCGDYYLFAYNAAQALGWSYIGLKSIIHLTFESYGNLYSNVHVPLKVFQTLALLEIFHAAFGLVKSNAVVTTLQVFSRVFILWGVTNIVVEAQIQIGFLLLLIAWIVTEVIRYSFYAGNIVSCVPQIIVWARYTLFIVLYPLGVTGELTSIYSSLPHIRDRNILTYPLPNLLNISFNYFYVIIAVMLVYIPVFPQLYLHMFAQRKKVLGGVHTKSD